MAPTDDRGRPGRRARRAARPLLAAALVGALLAGGCGGDIPWLGGGDGESRLPGERRPVLLASRGPVADARLASLAVTVPPARPLPEWPQPGGTPDRAIGNIAGAADLEEIGSAGVGRGHSPESPLLGPPVVAEGKVFAIDAAGQVTAFTAGQGRRLWSRRTHERRAPDRLAGGGIAYDQGRLFVTLAAGAVVALSAGDGAELWRAEVRAPLRAPPVVAGGRVLAKTGDNQLLALDAATGEPLWRHAGIFEPASLLGGAPPAVAGGAVVVAYSSGEVFALALGDGRPLWSDTVLRPRRVLAADTIGDITGAPVIDRDRVIVAGAGGETAAFDLARGDRLWEVDLTSFDTPWVAGDFVFLVTERGELVCLLRGGGRVRWVRSVAEALGEDAEPGTLWSGPIMVGGRLLLAGTDGRLLAFSPEDGALVARAEIGDGARIGPVAADGLIYVLTDDADVVAFR